ncbi:MAG: hypothetical protein LUO93_10720 [Methanomicrobiales archaeon]|nr:hypothetical protein [Methanomicrobiales archaeon]
MQFPTCKAPVKRDRVRISSLFDEFAVSKFTGYCKILMGREEHILALQEGTYTLAESGTGKGAEAFKAIIELGNSMGSAVLCPLTVKQFQVTLLFNAPFRIVFSSEPGAGEEKEQRREPAERSPRAEISQPAAQTTAPVTRIHPVSIPSTAGKAKRVRSIKITAELRDEKDRKPVHVARSGEGGRGKKIDQLTLESIKELKETFQADAADLLRELHMEHLIPPEEKNSRKSNSENR